MENLSLTSTQSPLTIPNSILSPPFIITRPRRNVYFPYNKTHKRIFIPLAKRRNPLADVPDEIMNNLNKRDLIELDFGRKIGENPKLTLTKILERKSGSEANFMEVEKYFNRKNGNIDWSVYVDAEWTEESFGDGFDSDKPEPKREFEVSNGADISEMPALRRPVGEVKNKVIGATNSKVLGISLRRPSVSSKKKNEVKLDNLVWAETGGGGGGGSKSNLRLPNVILRRPSSSVQDGGGPKPDGSYINLRRKPTANDEKDDDKASMLNVKPELTLSVWSETLKDNSGGTTLLKRPERGNMEKLNDANKSELINESGTKGWMNGAESGYEVGMTNGRQSTESISDVMSLLQKPRATMPRSISNGTPGLPGDGDLKNSDPEGLMNGAESGYEVGMTNGQRTESISDVMSLLQKPRAITLRSMSNGTPGMPGDGDLKNSDPEELMNGVESWYEVGMTNGQQSTESLLDVMSLLQKPRPITPRSMSNGTPGMPGDDDKKKSNPEVDMILEHKQSDDFLQTGTQKLAQTGAECFREEIRLQKPAYSNSESNFESVLLGRPNRLDSSMKDMSNVIQKGTHVFLERSLGESEPSLLGPLTETEDADWARIELHFNHGDRVGVELISCSVRGFAVYFGSLTGFLPYRSIPSKMKFLGFESWLRRNGLRPSNYSENLGIIGTDNYLDDIISLESIPPSDEGTEFKLTPDMELEDLWRIYTQQKIKHLSTYLGQRCRVHISMADKKSRKLIFSMTGKETEEETEKRRRLMAKLSVGDVVKCCIKKITYFGIFVEIEGVTALIHQSDVSWDPALNLASSLKIGQVIDAKVHQLDFLMDRIYLSLKEITPDPLNEAMECIAGTSSSSGGLESMQADSEWSEVDTLVEELKESNGIQAVTKGRFFLSPGLAPTFQIYMASTEEDRYKLLARSGNKVQEVLIQSSLDKEEMKSIIAKCTAALDL